MLHVELVYNKTLIFTIIMSNACDGALGIIEAVNTNKRGNVL